MKRIILISTILILFAVSAYAELQNLGVDSLGNRLIYDTDLDVTWYDYTSLSNTWQNQVDWADALSVTFGSNTYTDWRLPTTVDGPWVMGYDGTTTGGYNITTSEMGHLYYTELGNEADYDIFGNYTGCDTLFCLSNTSFFNNLQPEPYWSGTQDAAFPLNAWVFFFRHGIQGNNWIETNNYAIAVRDGLAEAASLDTWHIRSQGTFDALNRITYGNNMFVIVGDNGVIITSPDGTDWTTRTSGTTNNLNGITYQNNMFFALGDQGLFLISTDGIDWQAKTVDAQPLYDIIYANNFYLLGGYNYIAKSTDLTVWSKGNGYLSPPGVYTLAYGNNLFAHSGEQGDIYTSTNGIDWIKRQDNGCYIGKIIYVNNIFYAVGCVSTGTFSSVGYTSIDGIVWTEINSLKEPGIIFSDIVYGNGTFVATGSYGQLKISTDGISWTPRAINYNVTWAYTIAFGNDTFVIVGDDGLILQSDPVTGPISQFNLYDQDQDWIIGDFELLNAIDEWASGLLGDFELLNLIDFWTAGCYQWDAVTNSHNAGC